MNKILENISGKKEILLGNEAIVRGALESGVQFVSTYPGTPSSEVGNLFSQIAKEAGVYFEYSTNEKVALEASIGASYSGLRVLAVMKHFGLNVCAEALIPLCYTGTKGPLVLSVADDPSCWSSAQSEQNSRAFADLAHIPILEPSEPQECKDFIKLAFEISERFKIPVMVRTTTRVAHQSSPVILEQVRKEIKQGEFTKNPDQFSTMPPRTLRMHKELLAKIEEIKKTSEIHKINSTKERKKEDRKQNIGIVTSGISYLYVMEALKELDLNLPVFKIGFFYPLPEEKIKKFIKKLKKVLIVEELEPCLEREVERLAKNVNPKLQIFGKSHLPEVGELKPEDVILAIAQVVQKKIKVDFKSHLKKFQGLPLEKRFPQLCTAEFAPPGCPYWLVFSAIKKVAPENTVFGGDIGCYMIAANPPHFIQDYLLCMGSSLGVAHGIKKSTNQKVIALIGDSTFFHSGIPALVNTVFNKSNPLIVILDNSTTAMTGHQPHPGMGKTGMGDKTEEIKIENIVRAIGVKHVKVIDPQNFEEMGNTIKEFLEKDEVSVIIAERICALLTKRLKK